MHHAAHAGLAEPIQRHSGRSALSPGALTPPGHPSSWHTHLARLIVASTFLGRDAEGGPLLLPLPPLAAPATAGSCVVPSALSPSSSSPSGMMP